MEKSSAQASAGSDSTAPAGGALESAGDGSCGDIKYVLELSYAYI